MMNGFYSLKLVESIPVIEDGRDCGMIFKLSLRIGDPGSAEAVAAAAAAAVAAPGEFFTLPGESAPTGYLVRRATCEKDEKRNDLYFIRCECVLPGSGVEQLGPAAESTGADGETLRTVKYSIPRDAAFAPRVGEMLEWDAPEEYRCEKVEDLIDPVTGKRVVTLTGRRTRYGLVREWRSEKFAGFDEKHRPLRDITYHSLWRVRASDAGNFEGLSGTLASGWASGRAVVTAVEPGKINDSEYEFTLSAEDENNSSFNPAYSVDSRSDLRSRRDFRATLSDFRLTPEMAGFRRENGRWAHLENWSASSDCPFAGTTGPDESLIDAVFKCVLIRESSYVPGGAAAAIPGMVRWADTRVFQGTVGGCSGSFLRADMDCEELLDNSGNRWTKISRSWQRAPEGRSWNASYWNLR